MKSITLTICVVMMLVPLTAGAAARCRRWQEKGKENKMSKMRIAVLIVALVAALGVALSLKATAVQAAPPDAPAAYDAAHGPDVVAIPGSFNVYVSEDALWQQFYHAADYHDARIASKLLRIINMRHEYRVHLPR